jgi:FKBP-type peptidyl-prolyl cis-trans isomerase 2
MDHYFREPKWKGSIMAQAKTGSHVRVNFTGKLDDGTIFATSANDEPIEFTLGENEVLPAIEEAVEGMESGEMKTVRIAAEDAFGLRREDLVQEIPRDSFPDDAEVEIGQQLWVDEMDEEPVTVSVVDLSDSTVTIDANHPLAGEDLIFDLEVLDVSEE